MEIEYRKALEPHMGRLVREDGSIDLNLAEELLVSVGLHDLNKAEQIISDLRG